MRAGERRAAARFVALTLGAVALAAGCGGADEEPGVPVRDAAALAAAAATITDADIVRRIGVMAHDSMRGRATPSPELEEVALWIAAEFRAMGLEPGGDDGGYLQRYPIPQRDSAAPVGPVPTAPNVVGILPGSDPLLSGEYLVFSAHMDHVGVRRPDESGDSIYNGADDDASGTATILEVAEAMAALAVPPRRSVIFVAVSGEERGLWGSEHFVASAPVPVSAMVANLNADMVGRNWTDTIVAIGKEHSELGAILERVNAAHPELGMTAIDDLWPDERFYFRSDHFNFARQGVPILFFFNGVHDDYHRPSDEVEKIDGEKTARIGRLLFYLGMEVADAGSAPAWNPESYEQIVEGAGR
ncbi:MAG: M20/M25/M40 family metallo-hydrolase [Longimicrobiales bacterium]|nr:M20/M25/M40 family metallo-hydrolase [Longimicrobiales bacterium]